MTCRRSAGSCRGRRSRAEALSPAGRLLVGAYFSHEYAVEGAALCNPSIVEHPDQSGLDRQSRWSTPTPLRSPRHGWELIQVGNCGSPIETDAGRLVLTHGVGPMRQYAIGALLLDLSIN
jgi:predicted GH43/DUF377 family glycosyl hydrolase